ncbi:MAG: hypothetical protein EBU90_20440 [Proteobacteria bacterium]|nr:hypothetical protein [Pseudomonadota bacterium]
MNRKDIQFINEARASKKVEQKMIYRLAVDAVNDPLVYAKVQLVTCNLKHKKGKGEWLYTSFNPSTKTFDVSSQAVVNEWERAKLTDLAAWEAQTIYRLNKFKIKNEYKQKTIKAIQKIVQQFITVPGIEWREFQYAPYSSQARSMDLILVGKSHTDWVKAHHEVEQHLGDEDILGIKDLFKIL